MIMCFDCFCTVKVIEDLPHKNNKKNYYGEFVEYIYTLSIVRW